MRTLVVVSAIVVAGFCFYWFDPRIMADRAASALADQAWAQTRHSVDIIAREGLNSSAANVAFARAQRVVFLNDCARSKFVYNKTTIQKWDNIIFSCKLGIAERDSEWHAVTGVDFGWNEK